MSRSGRAPANRGRTPNLVSRAVLGVLAEGPAYQYQVTSLIQERMGPGWRDLGGRVSQAFKALEQDGLIRPTARAAPESNARVFYEITDAGVADFVEFVGEDFRVRLPKRPIQVQLAFAGPTQTKEVLSRLEAYENDCKKLVGKLLGAPEKASPARARSVTVLRADEVLLGLSLTADVEHVEAELAWVRHARETIRWLSSEQGTLWPGRRSSERQRQARVRLLDRLSGTTRAEPAQDDPEKER